MCGILGLLAPGAHPNLQPQLKCLAHRGPDDEGGYADADIFLGARRLSIIDVAGGRQPLSNGHCPAGPADQVWVAHNGEIYNYLELRAELERRGHVFHTRSDTEVIAHAYEAWGPACVQRLRGIFAFAVWAAGRRRLLLARDRFGVKPLYYSHLPDGRLIFASEIGPLLDARPELRRADPAALSALFTLGFVPSPRTAFDGIQKLPAAHTLTAENGAVRLERYWDLPLEPEHRPSANGRGEAAEALAEHLRRAVVEQRMSEVPLGALISGGLDSSSIAALLQAESGEPLRTFNIGFAHAGYDETPHAERAARHIGTRHQHLTFEEADLERYPEVMARLEEPQCSATALPIYRLYEACRRAGLTVILTGEGADELLGGYHWFQGDDRARRLLWLPRPLRRFLALAPLPISEAGRRVMQSGARDLAARYALWHGPGPADSILGPAMRYQTEAAEKWRADWPAGLAALPAARQLQYVEVRARLADFINFEVDRMSMAHSVEARVPFLDHELWEFAARLPAAWALDVRQPKRLLREAMRGRLPPDILARRKQGLAAPYADWLRKPRLPEWAEAVLSDGALAETGYFEAAGVARLRAEHQGGRRNHGRVLMGVLSTQLWHRQFIQA